MKRMSRDLVVLALLAAVGVLLMLFDSSNVVVLQAFGITLFLVTGTHITRRVLFHRLDLQEIARFAASHPVGAAIVFASILVFLVAVMHIGMSVLK